LEIFRVDSNNNVFFPSKDVYNVIEREKCTSFKEDIIGEHFRAIGFF
jgi:hypothetical protein